MHSAHSGWSISVRLDSKLNRRMVERKWWDIGVGIGCSASGCVRVDVVPFVEWPGRLGLEMPFVDACAEDDGPWDGILWMTLSCRSTKDSFGAG